VPGAAPATCTTSVRRAALPPAPAPIPSTATTPAVAQPATRIILSGIEIAHMIRKDLMQNDGGTNTAAEQFYSLVM
jgi:hypothetical protein